MIYLIAILIYLFTLAGVGIYKSRHVKTGADFSSCRQVTFTVDSCLHYAGRLDWNRLDCRQCWEDIPDRIGRPDFALGQRDWSGYIDPSSPKGAKF